MFSRPKDRICSLRLVGLLLFFLPIFLSAQSSAQRFINKFRPLTDSLAAVYGIPAAVMLGVSILESGSGTSRNARLLNNYFGIVGKNNLMRTHGIRSRYRQYATDTGSFVDFCRLLTRKRFYATLKNNTDPTLWIKAISATGYSEVPAVWQQRVLSTIRKHRL
jgi:Bax protein